MPSTNSIVIDRPVEDVFDLICDPRTYPAWLVGAQEIRTVSEDWPAEGARFEHRIGLGPVRVPGSTTVRALRRPSHVSLAAGMGPLGEARVDFDLRPRGTATEVTITESPSDGLARLGWYLYRPIAFGLLRGRNQLSLRGLADLAESTATAELVVR